MSPSACRRLISPLPRPPLPWYFPHALKLGLIAARWPGLLRSQRPRRRGFGGRQAGARPLLLGRSQSQPSNKEPIDAHVKPVSVTLPVSPRSPWSPGGQGQRAVGCGSTLDSASRQKRAGSACGWVSQAPSRLPPPHLTRARTHSLTPHDPTPSFPLRHSLISPPSSLSLKISRALSTFPISRLRRSWRLPHLTSATSNSRVPMP